MLPIVGADEIQRAIAEFDAQLRGQKAWQGWDQRASQKFALELNGKLYPPKKIVSIATGTPVSKFSGGPMTNDYLGRLDFRVIRLARSRVPSVAQQIPRFVVGKAYSRQDEITGRFGGSNQSGIAPSNSAPAIFLFTGGSGEKYGYNDDVDESGCLLYTGEGQVGDMTMTRGNLALALHASNGRALHVFQTTGKGKPCIYKGEFVYGSHFMRRGSDKNGDERSLIVFRLLPVSKTLQVEIDDSFDNEGVGGTPEAGKPSDLAELREVAIAACQSQPTTADPKETVKLTYQRSLKVKRYVLARAQGYCELCEEPAPFNRKSDGTPYLEPHHINRLSDGGLDHPLYVGAICPTCHRRIHFGGDGAVLNEELRANVAATEAELSGID